ncbi:unnamed protein product [Nezara viridula]|uniref:Uncharacterized protein n=1 Tax=Nezara viridula TaxID=85310 RepID=A0A9P0HUH0_NEZVI|nr:unnamed protein product [Nezara viridula]
MMEVCFPLTSNDKLCKKHLVIDELKKLVKNVECCDDKTPICRAIKKADDKQPGETKCYCGSSPGYHEHVMMDGQLARAEKTEGESSYKAVGARWCPPCVHVKPLMDPIHSCYRADKGQSKHGDGIVPRNGMPSQERVSAGDLNRSVKRQEIVNRTSSARQHGSVNMADSNRLTCPQEIMSVDKYQRPDGQQGSDGEGGRQTSFRQGTRTEGSTEAMDATQDEVFGGQRCPYQHPEPTRVNYYCPTGDPKHVHWSPSHTHGCRYPNTCVASCFHHPVYHDWIYQQPKYKSYLQNVNDKPFMKGF